MLPRTMQKYLIRNILRINKKSGEDQQQIALLRFPDLWKKTSQPDLSIKKI